MIDLHAHILPGIDDGPEGLDGSLAFARAAAKCGTHLITCTPHLRSDHPHVRPEELAYRCRVLEAALVEQGIPVRVLPGAEVDLLWAGAASPEELRLATYGQRGTDMLLETPYGPLPPNFNDLVERIAERGVRVLLAHPERNPTFQRDPAQVLELVERGVLVQLTAMSVTRKGRGSRSRTVARWLIEQGAAHVIASDAHSAGPRRSPDRAEAISVLTSMSPAQAEWILHEVPQAIVAGEPLPPRPLEAASSGPMMRLRRRADQRRGAADTPVG